MDKQKIPDLNGLGLQGSYPSEKKKAATYSPALQRSTIGVSGLNFSVRNGKR